MDDCYITERKALLDSGAWECVQNSPHHIYTVGDHSAAVVRYCEDHNASEELIKAAWLHDIGKMSVKFSDDKGDHFYHHAEVSADIAKSLGETEYVVNLVRYHDAALNRDGSTPKQLAQLGRRWCEDLAILMMADLSGQHPTYQIGYKLKQRGNFLQQLFIELDSIE